MKGDIAEAIDLERAYQEHKFPGHRHTVGEWLLIMSKLLDDAKRAWASTHGDDAALHEIRQVVATGVAAMEQCGVRKRLSPPTRSTHAAVKEVIGEQAPDENAKRERDYEPPPPKLAGRPSTGSGV